ncbi:hypothetical protein RHAL1_02121 [Beijerinckiaceae bacterium RH AL1]|nr:hypothetical protein RHCH11_RHCH11_02078 [Beijerinckiaceae bacterium RH CH11]VVB46191.1 hypothetical protein RHAL8_02074 [Beijerinckiaceae bacterium RH AL8]VVC55207.1 hypothetical protein RHAL1_02121 [Beijerinckiaceae bacterium RH AL1]
MCFRPDLVLRRGLHKMEHIMSATIRVDATASNHSRLRPLEAPC